MNLKRLDPLYVVALAVAALLILFPPWFKQSRSNEFLGIRPLFAPPVYSFLVDLSTVPLAPTPTSAPPPPEQIAAQGSNGGPYYTVWRKGRIGYGVLATELLALGIVTATVGILRSRRANPHPPDKQASSG